MPAYTDDYYMKRAKNPFLSQYARNPGDRSGSGDPTGNRLYKTTGDLQKGEAWKASIPSPGTLRPSGGFGSSIGTGYNGAAAGIAAGAGPAKSTGYDLGYSPTVATVGTAGLAGLAPSNSPGVDTIRAIKNPAISEQVSRILSEISGLSGKTSEYLPKSKAVDDIVSGEMSGLSGLTFSPGENRNVLRTNVKDDAIASRITGGLSRYDGDVVSGRTEMDKLTAGIQNTEAETKAQTDRERAAIASHYGSEDDPTSVAGRLKAILAKSKIAQAGIANSLGEKISRSIGGGLAGGASKSWAAAQAAQKYGDLAASMAASNADMERANLLQVLSGQQANLGRANELLNTQIRREMIPTEMRSRLASDELSRLGGLSGLTGGNTIYNLDSPEISMERKLALASRLQAMDEMNRETPEAVYARRLGLISGLSGADLANTFYGVGGRFPSYRGPNINIDPGNPVPGYDDNFEPQIPTGPRRPSPSPRFRATPEGLYPALPPGYGVRGAFNSGSGVGWAGDSRLPENWGDLGTGDQANYLDEMSRYQGVNPADYE